MEFSDDPVVVDTAELAKPEEWADMFGAFFIKKNDNIADIVKGLNEFYSNTGIGAPAKKRKNTKKKEGEIAAKKKQANNQSK